MPTDDEYLQELRRLTDDLGHVPSLIDLDEHGAYSDNPYYSRWDDWESALEAAGLDTDDKPRDRKPIAREDLIEELQRLAAEHGEPVTAELIEDGQYSITPYDRVWESLPEAREEAGLDRGLEQHQDRIDTDDLLAELHRVGKIVDEPPKCRDVVKHGQHSVSTFLNRFDSWFDALEAAGFDVDQSRGGPIPREQLLADLHRLAEEHDEPVRHDDITEDGKYSLKTYYNRFGSLPEAREAAGLEAK